MIELLVGAGVFAAGQLVGRLQRPKRKHKEPAAVCGCKHHRSFHKAGVNGVPGPCWHENAIDGARCACQAYHGPDPLPSFYV